MGRLKEILIGWRNLIFGNPQTRQLAKERMEICGTCEHASRSVYLHCDRCGCYIPAKANSPDSNCPVGLW
ncbi:MAG: hypothetical protein K9H64_11455 [Bacteroidales bacterium]|nr:hypothetical protein [Bacteroidales bacterium]MCF8456607.1 hypothetical protein [Bacteroidales bacterium]